MTILSLPIPEGPHTIKLLERYLQALTLHQEGPTTPSFVRSERTLLRLAHQLSALSRTPLHRISGRTNKRLSLSAEQFEMLARVIVRQETEGHSYDDLLREELGLTTSFGERESVADTASSDAQAVEVIERLEGTVEALGSAPENPSSGFKRLSHFQQFSPGAAVPQGGMRPHGVVPGAEFSA